MIRAFLGAALPWQERLLTLLSAKPHWHLGRSQISELDRNLAMEIHDAEG